MRTGFFVLLSRQFVHALRYHHICPSVGEVSSSFDHPSHHLLPTNHLETTFRTPLFTVYRGVISRLIGVVIPSVEGVHERTSSSSDDLLFLNKFGGEEVRGVQDVKL